MRLRNKHTGDVWEFDGISMAISDSTKEKLGARGCSGSCYARSLSELNEEWEDVKPAEPLIKDEKVREAVRAWAILNRIDAPLIEIAAIDRCTLSIGGQGPRFETWNDSYFNNLVLKRLYTLAELCGEEEE